MEDKSKKHNLPVVTAALYNLSPDRYEIRRGSLPDAPLCPYGHNYKWIGYDKQTMQYVRFTKSVFKRLIVNLDQFFVEKHEKLLNESDND